MTIHWIDPESLSRKSSVLACDRLQGVQSYDVIAKKMCHVHWNFLQLSQKSRKPLRIMVPIS